jgi:transcriptional regulator with XRE-family HTH domain
VADTLGARLKAARITKQLSQQQVAEAVGVNRVRVSNWETDQHKPGAENLEALAALYGTTTRALLYGEPDAPTRTKNVSRETSENWARRRREEDTAAYRAPRHLRNLPQEIRVFLDELRLRFSKANVPEEEVERAMALLRRPEIFSWYSTGEPRDLEPAKVLRTMKAITELVILPELRERGRKV